MADLNLNALWPAYMTSGQISGCLLNLLDAFAEDPSIAVRGFTPCSAPDCARDHIHRSVPPALYTLLARAGLGDRMSALAQAQFLRSLDRRTGAWLWGIERPATQAAAHERARFVIRECVNRAIPSAQRTLDAVARHHGIPPIHSIDDRMIAEERAAFALADFAFACSPGVARSLEAEGLMPPERILLSSYGWDDRTFRVPARASYESADPLFIFVGYDGVRKGLMELLAAWRRVEPAARLWIVGGASEDVRTRMGDVLARPEVRVRESERDLATLYGQADVFTLPSHEEGSPLVTYMALAAGLPSLVSDAGAGGVVEDDVHGLIREPGDGDGLCAAIDLLARDASLRARLGSAARACAQDYTWSAVARRRREQLRAVVG